MTVDLDAATAKLRTLAWRAAGLTLLWCLVFFAAGRGFDALDAKAQRLLEHGVQTTATVVGVDEPAKSGWSIDVRYLSGRTAEIHLDSHRHWQAGQTLTLIYDPGDPDTVRTLDEKNENQFLVGICSITLFAALAGVGCSLSAVGRWWRRYRAARRTGWRAGTATVRLARRQRPRVYVRLRSGKRIEFAAVASTHSPSSGWRDRTLRIWLAGHGQSATVLFETDGRPRAVPVKVRW
jgi:hypothetical protein